MTDIFDDLARLRLAPESCGHVEASAIATAPIKSSPNGGEFLKGPIPLVWLSAAAKLRGKAPLAVALALWFQAGRRRRLENLQLTSDILNRFSVSRKAKYKGLAALVAVGLIGVQQIGKKNPLVTIIDRTLDKEAGVPVEGLTTSRCGSDQG